MALAARVLRLAPLLVGGVVLLLWAYEPGTTVVAIPAWALFELARQHGRRRDDHRRRRAAAVRARAAILPFADSGAEMVSLTLRNLAICELALAVGYAMWHSRAAIEREVAAREAEADARLGEERLRIAREVHDVVAHAMVAINVQAGVAAHLIDQDTEQAREALLHIKRTSGDALTDLRATLGVLRDPARTAPVGPGRRARRSRRRRRAAACGGRRGDGRRRRFGASRRRCTRRATGSCRRR